MCIEKLPPFIKMLLGSIFGIIAGIILGLVFSSLIVWISEQITTSNNVGPSQTEFYKIATFLGMGAGAIVGAIFGALTYNRKQQ